MNATKNDLSFNSTTLDWGALNDSLEMAHGLILNDIRSLTAELQDKQMYEGETDWLIAERIAKKGEQLQRVAETLHTVQGAATRKGLEIVNKVKEVSQ